MATKTVKSLIYKNKKGTCLVFFDSETYVELSNDLIYKYQIHKGTIIDEELENKILSEQKIIDVKQSAYIFAAYKPRTKKQVIDKLKLKKFNHLEISIAVDFLNDFKLLNDEKYANTFAKEYIIRKPCSSKKIIQELLQRGIEKDIAVQAASTAIQPKDEFDLAVKAGEKKLRAIKHKPIEKQLQSIKSYLQRNGFNWDITKKAISVIFS